LSHRDGGQRKLPRQALARRFLAGVLAAGLVLFTVLTAVELALDYRHEVALVAAGLDAVQRRSEGRLEALLRQDDAAAIRRTLADLLQHPSVAHVQVITRAGTSYEAGQPVQPWRDRVQRVVRLQDDSGLLGILEVEASTSAIKSHLFDRFLRRLGLLFVVAVALSLLVLRQFDRLVVRHLDAIAAQMRRSNALNLREPLRLARAPVDDEINGLLDAFTQLRRHLLHEIEIHEASDRSQAAENRLNLLALGALPQALLRVTPDGRVGWLNARAAALCAPEQGKPVGAPLWQLLPAVRGHAAQSVEALYLRARTLPGLQAGRVLLPDTAGVKVFAARAVALRDAGDEIAGVLLLLEEAEVLVMPA
jgi:PAS domain-containing protein